MSPTPKIFRNIARDSSLAIILVGLSGPLWYLTTLVMARYYGAQEMGTYFIAWNMVLIISIICRLGLDNGLLRFSALLKTKGQVGSLRRLFWPALGLTFLLGLIAAASLFFTREWLAIRFNAPSLPLVLIFVAPALPFFAVSFGMLETIRALGGVQYAVFQKYALSNFTLIIFLLILAYWRGNSIGKYEALGLAAFLSVLVNLGFLAASLHFKSGWQESDPIPGESSFRDLFWYSLPMFLNTLLGALAFIDRLILGLFTTPQEVAYYEVAAKAEVLIALPLVALNNVIPPLVVKLYECGNFAGLEMMAQTTARWAYYLSLPLTLLLIFLAPELLGIFGENFKEAIFAVRVLAVAMLINVTMGSVVFILNMTGHQWKVTLIRLAATIITIALMLGLTRAYGLNGMAVASALGLIGINVVLAFAVWRFLKVKAFAGEIRWINISALLGTILFLACKPLTGPVPAAGLFLLLYLALVFKPLKREIWLTLQSGEGALCAAEKNYPT